MYGLYKEPDIFEESYHDLEGRTCWSRWYIILLQILQIKGKYDRVSG